MGDRQEIMGNAAKRVGLKLLVKALLHAAKIDKISKGVKKGDAWDEIQQLGLYFAFKNPYKLTILTSSFYKLFH